MPVESRLHFANLYTKDCRISTDPPPSVVVLPNRIEVNRRWIFGASQPNVCDGVPYLFFFSRTDAKNRNLRCRTAKSC